MDVNGTNNAAHAPAPVVAGVDGCPAGWLCIVREGGTGEVRSCIHAGARGVFSLTPVSAVLCIDIPIGLTDRGPRAADLEARALLAPRQSSSVFPSPIRPVLGEPDYAAACAASRRLDGKGISRQSFAIYDRVREVDDLLRADASLRGRVREVHPEVCFCAWNSGRPMAHAKKSAEGLAERRALIDAHFGPGAFGAVRASHRRGAATDDDIADAFAALWTAERVAAGRAGTLPAAVPLDAHGLRMEMCF